MMLISIGLIAQPQGMPQGGPQNGERPARPEMKSPEEIAKMKSDMMKRELSLTDKQYKKVYKLIKKDQQYRQNQAENQFGGGMPPQFGGMGGPGGGMGGPGMGGGMMGGPGGGMGGPGMGGPGMGGQRPEGFPGIRPKENLVSDEYLEKQEKKLKKILTEEQYSLWRSKHPAEHTELPPKQIPEK